MGPGDGFKVPITDIAVNVTASPGKTIAQITNPSTQRLWVAELVVGFDGTSNSATPVTVRLARQTTAGTPTGNTTPTPVQCDSGGPAALQTLVVAGSGAWTTEPTTGDILWEVKVHPQSGMIYTFPLGDEDVIAASGRLGLVMWAAAAVNVTGHLKWKS